MTGGGPPEQSADEGNQFLQNPTQAENSARTSPKKLSIITDLGQSAQQYPEVSMVPTPLLAHNAPTFTAEQLRSPSQQSQLPSKRVVSTSIVPDELENSTQRSQLSPRMPSQTVASPVGGTSVARAGSLYIPKRGSQQSPIYVTRSASVGGPQRQPSTVLHRERKSENGIDSAVGDVPEEVYLASDFEGYQTAWTRVKFAGKGSFSDVVLAKPNPQFILPEFVDQVTRVADEEIRDLEASNKVSDTKKEHSSLLVAVKITRLKPGKEASQLEYFRRDLEVMEFLPHHPSLMRLIGYSVDEQQHNRAFTILPYCAGGDLFDLVAQHRSKMSSKLVRRLFVDVCSAVVFLHENKIVHRDIKLENVLLDVKVSQLLSLEHPDKFEMPLAVVTDMGLSRRIDLENPMLTTRCGSDDYVPPEIMLGQPYDGRETDSWALGVLLYAMMEGRLPFDAPPAVAHMEGNRARLRTAHRIARVDWGWFKRKEPDPEWAGGVEVVEGCLKRRAQRRLAKDTLKMPWVFEALPEVVCDPHNVDDLWQLFVQ